MKNRILLSLAMMMIVIVAGMLLTNQVLDAEVWMFGYVCTWIAGVITFFGYMDKRRNAND